MTLVPGCVATVGSRPGARRHGSATPLARRPPGGPRGLSAAYRFADAWRRGPLELAQIIRRYAPAAWPRVVEVGSYPRLGRVKEIADIAIAAIEEARLFPLMDAHLRLWKDSEGWEEDDGTWVDPEVYPFTASFIPLTNEDTVYSCNAATASAGEALLALLVSDGHDERENREAAEAALVRSRAALRASGDDATAARIEGLIVAGEALRGVPVRSTRDRFEHIALAAVLHEDAAGVFLALPGGLAHIPTLCDYIDGGYDNPFLNPDAEMWLATGLDTYPWSLAHVEDCMAWWADACPIIERASAALAALAAPGALHAALPAIEAAVARGYRLAGRDVPVGLRLADSGHASTL